MFPADAAGAGGGRAVCVVVGPGGVDSARLRQLAGGGPVHLLITDNTHTASYGSTVHVHHLSEADLTADDRVPNLYEPSPADFTHRVRRTLTRLHHEYRFAAVEFPVWGGLGFRAVQAKRAGLAFGDVVLTARLDDTSRRVREAGGRWPAGLDQLERDFAERYSYEYADARDKPVAEVADHVRHHGWRDMPDPIVEPRTDPPLVTIGVPYHNLGQYLPDTLATVAAQTYPHLDVIVIDDGSTDPISRQVFDDLSIRYPHIRFLRQSNAGIGATRNRCLREARGEYFIPVDADNLARPDMVTKFVTAMERNPHLSAATCYYTAFDGDHTDQTLYAVRPVGGPYTMSAVRNVYGDANAAFRTADLRAVGGYEEDRGTSCEDWEAFVKLANAGRRIGVVPDYLFDYRHREAGFSRVTSGFANHQRVLRQFEGCDRLPPGEAAVLWSALLGFQQEIERLRDERRSLRYRLADRLHTAGRGLKRLARAVSRRS